ncbi:hypothetical protein QM999_07475 [Pectobacterium cacticida]|uniref:hypothetical protein n=1 Tax=Pectobacterium cacticida TaxID=69221 RepID=UPI002FF2DD19
MNFNRLECQIFIESELSCPDPSLFIKFKEEFANYSLPADKIEQLRAAAYNDAKNIFFKASLSFLEATYGIINKHTSWAIIKLYYSVFYSLRVILLLSGYAVFKNGSGEIFLISLIEGSSPKKISTKKCRGDHKCTIKAFKETFSDNELLNTNTIDGINIFEWIMTCRELVNYRVSSFIEPEFGYELLPLIRSNSQEYDNLAGNYLENELFIYCFDKKHTVYATPLVLIKRASDIFKQKSLLDVFESKKYAVLSDIIMNMGLRKSAVMNDIFSYSLVFTSDTEEECDIF